MQFIFRRGKMDDIVHPQPRSSTRMPGYNSSAAASHVSDGTRARSRDAA